MIHFGMYFDYNPVIAMLNNLLGILPIKEKLNEDPIEL
jgi:hypothetical protein